MNEVAVFRVGDKFKLQNNGENYGILTVFSGGVIPKDTRIDRLKLNKKMTMGMVISDRGLSLTLGLSKIK